MIQVQHKDFKHWYSLKNKKINLIIYHFFQESRFFIIVIIINNI